ncbi:MAG: hypothetical protein HGA45_32465 [Chloroflexales bacterium]|nr:hypothetical protein [Chloroflexales bacterium]
MRDAIFDRMHFIAQFELRALVEELLDAPDEAGRQEVAAAMRLWLRCHCESCGTLIRRELRRRGEEYCFVCFPPPERDDLPPTPPATQEPDDVPF